MKNSVNDIIVLRDTDGFCEVSVDFDIDNNIGLLKVKSIKADNKLVSVIELGPEYACKLRVLAELLEVETE